MSPYLCLKNWTIVFILLAIYAFQPAFLNAAQDLPCLDNIGPSDALMITAPDGQTLYKKNETVKCIPASTLKILTALAAIHHIGLSYRFRTEFYVDSDRNLKIKGYGDPLLTSEVWQEIADALAHKIRKINNLILDVSFFSQNIRIPGVEKSTNPYDAPVGALCANFNTVWFDRDQKGEVISAEPQTPITPFAREKISLLGFKRGRYTFTHDQKEAAHYAGDLFLHFLNERGVKMNGEIRLGALVSDDKLIYTYLSRFTLEEVLKKTMAFSNNFIANQIFISLGAHVYGQPATLKKGVRVVCDYLKNELNLKDFEIVEGSGISRKNRISARDMITVLDRFKPYRHLLKKSGKTLIKTGTLDGIRTRAVYVEGSPGRTFYYVLFLNNNHSDIKALLECIEGFFAE